MQERTNETNMKAVQNSFQNLEDPQLDIHINYKNGQENQIQNENEDFEYRPYVEVKE